MHSLSHRLIKKKYIHGVAATWCFKPKVVCSTKHNFFPVLFFCSILILPLGYNSRTHQTLARSLIFFQWLTNGTASQTISISDSAVTLGIEFMNTCCFIVYENFFPRFWETDSVTKQINEMLNITKDPRFADCPNKLPATLLSDIRRWSAAESMSLKTPLLSPSRPKLFRNSWNTWLWSKS